MLLSFSTAVLAKGQHGGMGSSGRSITAPLFVCVLWAQSMYVSGPTQQSPYFLSKVAQNHPTLHSTLSTHLLTFMILVKQF